jgi:drug/metabolite transporter (DMT)-like permease
MSPSEPERRALLIARLAMVGAAVLWSTGGFFAKAPVFDGWDPAIRGPMLAFWRSVFAALILAPLIRRPRYRHAMIPLAVAFPGMNVTFLTAMSLTTAANTIWLQSTSPWWVFLINLVFLRHKAARRELIPLGFAMFGVGLILAFESQGQDQWGVTFGLASGVCFGSVVVLMHRLREEDYAWVLVIGHTATGLVLLPWIIAGGQLPTLPQFAVLVIFAAVQMAAPYVLLSFALRWIHSQEAAAISLLEPVLLPLLVLATWGERPAWWTIVGGGLILLGLALRYWVLEPRRRPEPVDLVVEP